MEKIQDLFVGTYEIPEAAQYLSNTHPFATNRIVNAQKLRYWIRTSVPEINPPDFPFSKRLISFYDLISMRMVAVMRSRGIQLKEIRSAEKYIREQFGIQYPFINREIWTYGSNVYVQLEKFLIAASRYGQQAMDFFQEWVEKVDLDMSFDSDDYVESWHPYDDITLDPKVQIGSPCISGTRIPSQSIWRKIKAGDTAEVIADLYDINLSQIKHVIEWEQQLEGINEKATVLA